MRELVAEVLLRLLKPVAATVLGVLVWIAATGPFGIAGSAELALLAWLVGAAFVLLVQEGPI